MNLVTRIHRRLYDLAVRAGLSPYKRLWVQTAADWDADYASGKLDYYGAYREQGRYSVLVGLVRAFPKPPRILDVGCGVGILRARLPEDAVASYVGIDPSEVAIERARQQQFARSEFHATDVPTAEMGTFDLIILNEMMCYVEDLDALLETLKLSLAPDGQLLTSMFGHAGETALHRTVGRHFTQLDCVTVQRDVKPRNRWRVASYVAPESAGNAAQARETPLEAELRLSAS